MAAAPIGLQSFVVSLVLLLSSSRVYAQFCANFPNDAALAIPDLADQFSFRVEANFDEHNRTLIVYEIYDSVNNRGSLFFRTNGTASHLIFDYDDNEIFFLSGYGPDRTCFVQSFTDSPMFVSSTFGLTNITGSPRIGTASGFLLQVQNNPPPTTFIGNEMVRGIPVAHYRACFDRFNSTYYADYYYSSITWNYAAPFDMVPYDPIPILVTIRGNRTEEDGVEQFYHVYSIYDYHTGPDSSHDRNFQVPGGQVCRGRTPGIPVPSVPNFFSATFQYSFSSDSRPSRVTTVREFYHLTHQLFRIDTYYDGSRGGTAGAVTLVHDFGTMTEYVINRHTSTCLTSTIGNGSILTFDVISDEEQGTRLFSPRDLFFLQDTFNYTYEGVTNVRGVPVDSWLSVRDFESFSGTGANLTDGVVELFFTRPDFNSTSTLSTEQGAIPWAVKIRGVITYSNGTNTFRSNITMESDVYDFSSNEPSYDAFDVSLCFDASELHTLVLVFYNVSVTGLDFGELRTNLRSSIQGFTNLQPLQINNIQLLFSNESRLVVALHLANLSSSSQLTGSATPITADYAFAQITNSTTADGFLPFTVLINGTEVTPRLLRFGRGRNSTVMPPQTCPSNNSTDMPPNTTPTTNNTCVDNITNRLMLTDAVVAGIALGLFFAGLLLGILGALITCCLCKCMCENRGSFNVKGSSSVRYKKHDDELDRIS